MVGRSERRSRAKWEASFVRVCASSSSCEGMEVAVVSQVPRSCGERASGRWEMEVGMGICREKVRCGERLMWAMREVEICA